jgi:hypothetical protein
MTVFWFLCFVVSSIFAFYFLNDLKHTSKLVKGAEDKLIEANQKFSEANQKFAEARNISNAAEASVKATKEENVLLHNAIEEVVNLWINDTWKSITDRLTATNHATQKTRLDKTFETCRKHGIDFDGRQERAFYVRLETKWKEEIVAEKAKQEQQRIKEIMREEQQAEKMRAAELRKIEEDRKVLEKKLSEASERMQLLQKMAKLEKLTAEQQEELQQVTAENSKLASEIEEKDRRKSMAEQTKAGNVYVISNIGSFGENVYKVGMTRRLIPEDRIKELGDASVPFPFDCHMMIPSEDAPKLESVLHEALWQHRLNLVNDRKEFFKAEIELIRSVVDKHASGSVYKFIPVPEAQDWRESEAKRAQKDYGKYHDDIEDSDESNEAA